MEFPKKNSSRTKVIDSALFLLSGSQQIQVTTSSQIMQYAATTTATPESTALLVKLTAEHAHVEMAHVTQENRAPLARKTVELVNSILMRMKFCITTGLLLLLALSQTVEAAPASPDECKAKINIELAYEQRYYRYKLFGLPLAEDAAIGSVYHDSEGNPWYKVSKEAWRTVAPGYESTQWSNTVMNNESEIQNPETRGILTRKEY